MAGCAHPPHMHECAVRPEKRTASHQSLRPKLVAAHWLVGSLESVGHECACLHIYRLSSRLTPATEAESLPRSSTSELASVMVAVLSKISPASTRHALLLHTYTAIRTPLHVNLTLAFLTTGLPCRSCYRSRICLSPAPRAYSPAPALRFIFCLSCVQRLTHLVLPSDLSMATSRFTSQYIGALLVTFIILWLRSLARQKSSLLSLLLRSE